jgi:hypothetical protein
VDDLRSQGFSSVRAIASQLNERAILTPRGGAWHSTSAARFAVAVANGKLSGDHGTDDWMSLILWPIRPKDPHHPLPETSSKPAAALVVSSEPSLENRVAYHLIRSPGLSVGSSRTIQA